MNTTTSTSRILGEAKRKVSPPTEEELTDPRRAYYYAINVIGGRWPEGEAAIAMSPTWAYPYARNVIGGRWPEGEAAIAKSPNDAYSYAKEVLKGRWPEAERPEAEAAIATSSWWGYRYARDVIGGRFPEGEPAIATEPRLAKLYLKQFPEAKLEWAMNGWIDWLDL